jgi:hypothetical protein
MWKQKHRNDRCEIGPQWGPFLLPSSVVTVMVASLARRISFNSPSIIVFEILSE